MKTIKKLAIANRGEVACRIHRTCQKMGIKTVLLHSTPDIQTKAYRICDETYNIGPGPTHQSYLNIEAQIKGALAAGADAIHPGFGFLSENSEFAKKVTEAGLIFVGPKAETIEAFGDKIQAKTLCKFADVPMVPGFQNQKADIKTLVNESEKIGYPVLVKAAAGGGGRGMRLIYKKEDAENEIRSAMNEALKAFGNETIFLEKYLDHAKHIEVQIFGDHKGQIYVLGERECSVQRKHQKIIEETPSPSLNESQRNELYAYARRIAEKGNYISAGTVEFMFQDHQFYFLEVNTRLQVEHTVTEEVLGIDLVEAQILTAQNKDVYLPKNFTPSGHSIELRLYAEDPYQNGIPSTGILGSIDFPLTPQRRLEIGVEASDEISPFYDSMIAKLISTQPTRIEAITDLIQWLSESKVFGVQTNRPLLKKILGHYDFILGSMDTNFFEKYFSQGLIPSLSETNVAFIEKNLKKFNELSHLKKEDDTFNPWSMGWREGTLMEKMSVSLKDIKFEQVGQNIWWQKGDDTFKFSLKSKKANDTENGNNIIKAPMPGSIFKILCSEGDSVDIGQTLVVLEAMKMEHSLKSDQTGKVNKIYFKVGDSVQDEDIILELS